eukprot:jgi/Botrbrau1/17659/Bobra.0166s0087.1
MHKLAIVLFTLYLAAEVSGDAQKPKPKKESPKYKIIGGTAEYEIRKYEPATYASLEVEKIKFDGAIYVGAKPLKKYFDGENVEGIKLNETTPIFIDFVPTVGPSGAFNGTTQDYNASYLIPEAAADEPPTPLAAPLGFKNITIVKAPKVYSYVTKFAGYAYEAAVLKHGTALLAALKEDDVDLDADSGWWVFAQYDGGFLESRNEVAWATTEKPPKKLWKVPFEEEDGPAALTA